MMYFTVSTHGYCIEYFKWRTDSVSEHYFYRISGGYRVIMVYVSAQSRKRKMAMTEVWEEKRQLRGITW